MIPSERGHAGAPSTSRKLKKRNPNQMQRPSTSDSSLQEYQINKDLPILPTEPELDLNEPDGDDDHSAAALQIDRNAEQFTPGSTLCAEPPQTWGTEEQSRSPESTFPHLCEETKVDSDIPHSEIEEPTHVSSPNRPIMRCDVCEEDGPELCCFRCDPEGLPYHTKCWDDERLHRPRRTPVHPKCPVDYADRLRELNEPNKWDSIKEKMFSEDLSNCFIEFDMNSSKFRLGPRAFPLLRHDHIQDSVQYPSLVSFIGRTMNGKSFLLRALQHGGAAHKFPTPIPAPGAKEHNHASTSSDIHLYADWKTAGTKAPILFLDFEGFGGSDMPNSLMKRIRSVANNLADLRRRKIEEVHPRLAYAFSTCVVFVTSGFLAEAADIGRRLISYASQGAKGVKNQGFRPSLFIVFNRFRDGDARGFDWSIDSSTKAFLAHDGLQDLKHFYSDIHVVYIPSIGQGQSDIALDQIENLQKCLREEHDKAFQRRQAFRLVFSPDQLTSFIWRALEQISVRRNWVFDWSIEMADTLFQPSEIDTPFVDLWTQCTKFHKKSRSRSSYPLTRETFTKHVNFCLRLQLVRKPPHGTQAGTIPQSLKATLEKIDQLLLDFSPCDQSHAGVKCQEIRLRHGDHHQGIISHQDGLAYRWPGSHTLYNAVPPQTFRERFEVELKQDESAEVSVRQLAMTLPEEIRSITTCFGCLQGPPSTFFACGHSFCFDCIRDLTDSNVRPHRLENIWCPIHKSMQRFSPRLLPIDSGYRILSLDGGGVKGLAQLIVLREIEQRCFGIPMTQLFDLIVGTSIGGQIALAFGTSTQPTPLTVAAAFEKFKDIMKSGFVRKGVGPYSAFGVILEKTKYKATPLEEQLQDLFGREMKLLGAITPVQGGVPHVAVTTVPFNNQKGPLKGYLVTNYNRKAREDLSPQPLLLGADILNCMPIWAAARCTSATVPLYHPFKWQGQMLLDGGFQLNCPAASAFSEAGCIWPDKCCDILVSLGTGISANRKQSSHKVSRVMKAIAQGLSDANDEWDTFYRKAPQKHRVFRLNPQYSGEGFELDDNRKLGDIRKETDTWIATPRIGDNITDICDQLIAALFFFHPAGSASGRVQAGEILCRLPVNIDARRNLISVMLRQPDSNLFAVGYDGTSRPHEYIEVTETNCAGVELRIPVKFHDSGDKGGVAIHIKMRNLGRNVGGNLGPRWSPISGSPYIL